jgi:hypothetical protein
MEAFNRGLEFTEVSMMDREGPFFLSLCCKPLTAWMGLPVLSGAAEAKVEILCRSGCAAGFVGV